MPQDPNRPTDRQQKMWKTWQLRDKYIRLGATYPKQLQKYNNLLRKQNNPWQRLQKGIEPHLNEKIRAANYRDDIYDWKRSQRIKKQMLAGMRRMARIRTIRDKFHRANKRFNTLRKMQPGDKRNKYNPATRYKQRIKRNKYQRYRYKTIKFLNRDNKRTARLRNWRRKTKYKYRRKWKKKKKGNITYYS